MKEELIKEYNEEDLMEYLQKCKILDPKKRKDLSVKFVVNYFTSHNLVLAVYIRSV